MNLLCNTYRHQRNKSSTIKTTRQEATRAAMYTAFTSGKVIQLILIKVFLD
jgi:hypothetical protein